MNKTKLCKPGPGIASDVIKEVKPIYLGLTKADDLTKCLHRLTQNANESFNSMIWERIPKHLICGISLIKLVVYDAAGNFNYGSQASKDTL